MPKQHPPHPRIEDLQSPSPADLADLLAVWESAVRATHTFLSEADIVNLRPQVRQALDAAPLLVIREADGRIAAFAGRSGDMLDMLFVRNEARGRGLGRALLRHALAAGVTRLDVNEQNPQAVGFYEHMGFTIADRSATDSQGRPWPVLHMRLKM